MAALSWVERGRLFVYPALMSLGVGMLASCAEKPPLPPPQKVAVEPPPLPPPPPRRRRVIPLPARKPMPPPETAANGLEPGTEMALAAPEAAPSLSPTQLIGLDQPAAKRLLGAATEQAEAPPASIWRYRTASCELDLFFYLDLRSGKMRTLHYAFKGDPGGGDDCLRSLAAAHGT